MMTTNMIRKDLQSSNLYDNGLALTGLACFTTHDLARDLVNDVVNLLSSTRPYVRKKAVLVLYKIFLKYPESLRPTFQRLKDKLEDVDPGVQSAAVNVICELARKNPRNYLSLAPVFFKLMNTSSNNWMLIKIIKLFGSLVPLEAKLGKKLLEPLTNLINSTSAMSLLYECINTVIAVLISISSESPNDFTASIQLCVQKLGVLIEDSDQNLKYLGLLAMGRILQTHPKAVQAHKDIVLRCLDDKDESIRLRALDLLYGMVSRKNIMEIVKKLMQHVDAAEGSFYRDELLSRIIDICSYNNYHYITNFEWYISVLVEMTKVEGSKHGIKIAEQIQDVTVRVKSVRHFSVSQMSLLVENAHLLLSGNSAQRNNISEVLLAAAWICGEYSEHVRDVPSVLEAMLRIKMSIVPGALLSIYVQNIAKLYSVLLTKYEKEEDWDSVESLDNLMLSKLPEFQYTDHLEAQERACNLVEIIQFVDERHTDREKMSESFGLLFDGELNPVASKAQRRVPIPDGLNLDEWINQPEEDSADEEDTDSEPEISFPTMSGQQPVTPSPTTSPVKINGKKQKHHQKQQEIELDMEEIRRRRQQENDNNPYYVKSDSKPSILSTTTSGIKKGLKGIDRSESLQTTISELQSPLEIPGVIGLHSYLQQQSSTITWKDAAKSSEKKKKKKSGKKGSGDGILAKTSKSGRRKKRTTVSSSDENADDSFVIHQVNRDDGEMPEGALSSDNEEQRKRNGSLNDEFKALDMNLDEPLREDEKLFIPKSYNKPEDDYSMYALPKNESKPFIRPETTTTTAAAASDVKEKKKRKKSTKKILVEKSSSKKSATKSSGEKQRKRKKSEKSIEENYTSLSSTAKPSSSKVEELIIPEDTTTIIPSSNGFGQSAMPKKLELLAQNDNLKVLGNVIFKSSSDISSSSSAAAIDGEEKNELRGNATIKFKNKGTDTIRRLELSVFESEQVKLDMSSGIKDASSIMLPFELTNKAANEHVLHFEFNKIDKTQKIRVTLMYCIEKNDGQNSEDRLNFILTFPSLRFLNYATIGETSYRIIVGDLVGSASEKVSSSQPFEIIIDKITKLSNLSVVELLNDSEAASLYAHSYDDSPVCILIKKLNDKYAIDVRCINEILAGSIANDLKEIISKIGD
uniref:AP-3 complex subunit delta domain-containing protein n=1 Tax=Panagrolaimus superbus TaxID=310955 RepID=A0A914Z675_9BILA